MDLTQEKRLNAILLQVFDRPPAEQRSFLEDTCGDDTDLLEEAMSYLDDDKHLGDFLEQPIIASMSPGADGESTEFAKTAPRAFELRGELRQRVPDRIGPFRLRELLGEGGMGAVYRAEQTEPVRRQVALKLIHSNLGGSQAHARFAIERQALALLAHPNIGQMLEAGTTDDGFPYFVMELVQGEPITQYCDQHALTIPERLELFLAVCRGVQHAHHNQILHRDLKPSNILVTEVDGRPVPKIIDFGVAKALAHPLTEISVATGKQMIGTPSFMSPEALQGSLDPTGGPGVDTRSDIYTLGVLLFELLTGVRPFEVRGLSFYQIGRRIIDRAAPTLGERWSGLDKATRKQVASAHGTDEAGLARHLDGELDDIVAKALARDRDQRYSSTSVLSTEIEGWLLRHTGVEVRLERQRADLEADTAERLATVLTHLLAGDDEGEPGPRSWLDRALRQVRANFGDRPGLLARLLRSISTGYGRLGLERQARSVLEEAEKHQDQMR